MNFVHRIGIPLAAFGIAYNGEFTFGNLLTALTFIVIAISQWVNHKDRIKFLEDARKDQVSWNKQIFDLVNTLSRDVAVLKAVKPKKELGL